MLNFGSARRDADDSGDNPTLSVLMAIFPGERPVRAPGCKNRPAPFPGEMSYKATKPGLVSVLYLLHALIVLLLVHHHHHHLVARSKSIAVSTMRRQEGRSDAGRNAE